MTFRNKYDSEVKLSWVLAALAGLLGATAFTHSAGYFVTFMTGNVQRVVSGFFRGEQWVAISAALLLLAFVSGVFAASLCRRYLWPSEPHGATVLTTVALVAATTFDATTGGGPEFAVPFFPIFLVTFGVGALNTAFISNGEVSIPLSYVTGTLVKMGQGAERHLHGGSVDDWLGYFLLFASFSAGAIASGVIGVVTGGTYLLAIASGVCALATVYIYYHADFHRARRR